MEVKFNQTALSCLHPALHQVQALEQTQEVRLAETLPEIGRILGCWGQVLIRGKEWRGTSMAASGGVMAQVLYAPEDGSAPQSVETWVPFQARWDFPENLPDGSICIWPSLCRLDARSISARKIMLRAGISLLGQAMVPVKAEIATPLEMPGDIQLLQNSYPVEVPREAGEKLFSVEEPLVLPASCPPVQKRLAQTVTPEITETKVTANRLVFRGKCRVHMLYIGENGGIHSWDWELPFSQYTELDREFDGEVSASVRPILTAMETEQTPEGTQNLKCSLAAQYVVYDRAVLALVEDAYSRNREITIKREELSLPIRLECREMEITAEGALPEDADRPVDFFPMAEQPAALPGGDMVTLRLPGQMQVLYYDSQGLLKGAWVKLEGSAALPSAQENRTALWLRPGDTPQVGYGADGQTVSWRCRVDTAILSGAPLSMVTALEAGELREPDPARPSLLLRRAEDGGLWALAKSCGSTVDAIRQANGLNREEPAPDQFLLIPVS